MSYPKMSINTIVLRAYVKKCSIFVQTAPSSVFFGVSVFLISLFHKLFNKTVENFSRANRMPLL